MKNISDNAQVYGDARVYGDAQVCGSAQVFGNAAVYRNAQVFGNAAVYGDARVCGSAQVFGDAQVFGNAAVYHDAQVFGNAQVCGDAQVFGNARVCGNAIIEKTSDYLVVGPAKSSGRFTTAHRDSKIGVRVNCGCFSGTVHEFSRAIEATHKDNQEALEQYRRFCQLIAFNFNVDPKEERSDTEGGMQ